MQDYDAKLASQKLCSRGALLAHVTQAGVKAGYTANMSDWTGPAIPFAVDAVKEFEQTMRQGEAGTPYSRVTCARNPKTARILDPRGFLRKTCTDRRSSARMSVYAPV